jgi:hypothetical protein
MALAIYWLIQIGIFAWCIHVIRNRAEIRTRNASRTDRPWEKVVMLILVPVISFGWVCFGGFPLKSHQLWQGGIGSAVLYAALIFRWVRLSRVPNSAASAPAAKRYLYRPDRGAVIHGPDPAEKLAALLRRGLLKPEALVASADSPDEWKPLTEWRELSPRE